MCFVFVCRCSVWIVVSMMLQIYSWRTIFGYLCQSTIWDTRASMKSAFRSIHKTIDRLKWSKEKEKIKHFFPVKESSEMKWIKKVFCSCVCERLIEESRKRKSTAELWGNEKEVLFFLLRHFGIIIFAQPERSVNNDFDAITNKKFRRCYNFTVYCVCLCNCFNLFSLIHIQFLLFQCKITNRSTKSVWANETTTKKQKEKSEKKHKLFCWCNYHLLCNIFNTSRPLHLIFIHLDSFAVTRKCLPNPNFWTVKII